MIKAIIVYWGLLLLLLLLFGFSNDEITWKLLVLDKNTWNHTTVSKHNYYQIGKVTWNYITEYKLLVSRIIT